MGSMERDRIVDQLRRAFAGESWHGPAVEEVLEGMTAEIARARPIAAAHSIWEIVLHIAAWEDVVRRWIQGEKGTLTPEQNWPEVSDTSEAAWARALTTLREGHGRLLEAAARLHDEQLDEPLGEKAPSRYVLLHGVIQHDLYHAGQIAVLKKA